jgi:hypothetical protein
MISESVEVPEVVVGSTTHVLPGQQGVLPR